MGASGTVLMKEVEGWNEFKMCLIIVIHTTVRNRVMVLSVGKVSRFFSFLIYFQSRGLVCVILTAGHAQKLCKDIEVSCFRVVFGYCVSNSLIYQFTRELTLLE